MWPQGKGLTGSNLRLIVLLLVLLGGILDLSDYVDFFFLLRNISGLVSCCCWIFFSVFPHRALCARSWDSCWILDYATNLEILSKHEEMTSCHEKFSAEHLTTCKNIVGLYLEGHLGLSNLWSKRPSHCGLPMDARNSQHFVRHFPAVSEYCRSDLVKDQLRFHNPFPCAGCTHAEGSIWVLGAPNFTLPATEVPLTWLETWVRAPATYFRDEGWACS